MNDVWKKLDSFAYDFHLGDIDRSNHSEYIKKVAVREKLKAELEAKTKMIQEF